MITCMEGNLAIFNTSIHASTCWLSNPTARNLLWRYPQQYKIYLHRGLYCGTLCSCKIREWQKCPYIREWLTKLWYIHTVEYYEVVKREWRNLYELSGSILKEKSCFKWKRNQAQYGTYCLLRKNVREVKYIPSAYCCTKKHGKVKRTPVRPVISSAWVGRGCGKK